MVLLAVSLTRIDDSRNERVIPSANESSRIIIMSVAEKVRQALMRRL